MKHWHVHDCWNWDVIVFKCLSVVLISSMSCRSWDVTRVSEYVDLEYLKWRNVKIYGEGAATYANLRAIITLEYEKGQKDTMNKESLCL